MKRLINAFVITIALAFGTIAHAGHPLGTDDAGGLIYTITDNIDLDLGGRGGFNKLSTDLMLLTGVAVRFL